MSFRAHIIPLSVKKTPLEEKTLVEIVWKTPNQELDCSLCCWTAWQRLQSKECFFRHQYVCTRVGVCLCLDLTFVDSARKPSASEILPHIPRLGPEDGRFHRMSPTKIDITRKDGSQLLSRRLDIVWPNPWPSSYLQGVKFPGRMGGHPRNSAPGRSWQGESWERDWPRAMPWLTDSFVIYIYIYIHTYIHIIV